MYEVCLSTVPLSHNQTIYVTYLVQIWALQSGILNMLLQRTRSVVTIERVGTSTTLSAELKMSRGGNSQSIYRHTDIVTRKNPLQSSSLYRTINSVKAKDNVKVRLRSMLSSRRRFPGVARVSWFQRYWICSSYLLDVFCSVDDANQQI